MPDIPTPALILIIGLVVFAIAMAVLSMASQGPRRR